MFLLILKRSYLDFLQENKLLDLLLPVSERKSRSYQWASFTLPAPSLSSPGSRRGRIPRTLAVPEPDCPGRQLCCLQMCAGLCYTRVHLLRASLTGLKEQGEVAAYFICTPWSVCCLARGPTLNPRACCRAHCCNFFWTAGDPLHLGHICGDQECKGHQKSSQAPCSVQGYVCGKHCLGMM